MVIGSAKRLASAGAAALVLSLGLVPAAAGAATPATVDFIGGAWDGGTGYPQDAPGGTGVDGAVADLGGGLTMTVNYSEMGTAVAVGRVGSTLGNLNVLDGAPVADLGNPGSPVPADCFSTTDLLGNPGTPGYGCHETSGFTFNIESTGANNSGSLVNYVRYDFAFNELVTLPGGVTLSDIDSLRVQYSGAFPADYQVDLYQDAVGFEFWTGAAGTPGTGSVPQMSLGAELTSSSMGGVSYVHTTSAPVGGRGGLTDSENVANRATFSATQPVRGFSVYYWDNLADSALDPGVSPTVGIDNFSALPSASQLEVSKTVVDGTAPWEFVVTVTGSDGSTRDVTLTDAVPTVAIDVDPGVTYTLTEASAPGFALESIDCGGGADSFVAAFDDGTSAAETSCVVTNVASVTPTDTPTDTSPAISPDPATGTAAATPTDTPPMPRPIAPQTGGVGNPGGAVLAPGWFAAAAAL